MHLDLVGSVLSHPSIVALGPLGRNLIGTAIIGLITGAIAKFLTPGRDPGGCVITMIIGIVGAYIALFIGRLIGLYGEGDAPGLIASVIGAIILLAIYHLITRRSGGSGPTV